MKSALLTAARLNVESNPRDQVVMVTCTYRPERYWRARHITAMIRAMRKWSETRGFKLRYAWCLEATKAGKEHYHVLLWLPRGVTLPKADKKGWWAHGMTRTERARNAVGYLAKYASKGGETRTLPKDSRLYGVGGLQGMHLAEWRWWRLPVWLREQVTPCELPRRLKMLGWCLTSGELVASPWRVEFAHGCLWLVPKSNAPPASSTGGMGGGTPPMQAQP